MTLDTAFYMLLVSAFVIFCYFLAFGISTRRLQVTGASKTSRLIGSGAFLIGWLLVAYFLGKTEILENFDRFPPPLFFYFVFLTVGSFIFVNSSWGTLLAKGLTYSELVGFNSFRVCVEIVLLIGAQEGLTPEALTLQGWNYDIVTGISAFVLAIYFPRFPNYRYIRIWNWLGLTLLLIVIGIGILSAPTSFRFFTEEPSNIWITKWPYILWPSLLVWSALTGHLLIFKKLKLDPKTLDH